MIFLDYDNHSETLKKLHSVIFERTRLHLTSDAFAFLCVEAVNAGEEIREKICDRVATSMDFADRLMEDEINLSTKCNFRSWYDA